jgi:hypothetical protein
MDFFGRNRLTFDRQSLKRDFGRMDAEAPADSGIKGAHI